MTGERRFNQDGSVEWSGQERRAQPQRFDQQALANEIICAIQAGVPKVPALTEEEHRWVQLAIQREAQSIKFRDAVIEKTLASLLWAAIAGIGYLVVDFFKNHGFK